MRIFNKVEELIGNTPLLKISRMNDGFCADVFAKLELFNPAGSVKDRVAKSMLDTAEKDGLINKDTVIIEPTSGNTGIGLASLATARNYELILTMPESMSIERRNLLKAYGAKIVLTPAKDGMKGAIAKAKELASETPNSFIPSQFENKANPLAHYTSTGVEIWNDTDGKVDIFVSCIGTGGTVTGTAKYLKEQNPNIKVVGVEPLSSPFLTEGKAGPHKIQGIGAGFKPNVLDLDICDEIQTVSNEEAFEYTKMFAHKEGVLVGISSGAGLCVASRLARMEENKGKNIVVILPDTGERYLSAFE